VAITPVLNGRQGASRVCGPLASFGPSWWVFSAYSSPRWVLDMSLQAGQLLSLCITSTSVITTELVTRGFDLPTTQGWFL
jgi:solute carrier family 35, member F1/2